MRADRYRIEVTLDPDSHHLTGRAVLDLTRADRKPLLRTDRRAPRGQAVEVAILLHPALTITRLTASGARSVRHRVNRPPVEPGDGFHPVEHLVVLPAPTDSFTLVVEYAGVLVQDAAAGERPGEIHNFAMRAHVGRDGIYLADGFWYPQPAAAGARSGSNLADFVLLVDPVDGMELAAGAERDDVLSEQSGRLAWRSPFPVEGMVLVGGRHDIHYAVHEGVDLYLHLKPEQAAHADGLLRAVRRNLDRYQPLIGRYPAREFSIVDNFFSSGFAFPTFTLLSSAVIDMGERSQTTHGYIDHEMLHAWWGNGIHVDPRDGNWCEALASYAANYYGHVLDGDEAEARRKRRNYCHFLSRLTPRRDRPLGTYGQEGGCGRSIAYNKGAMVFQMLARTMGQEKFWQAMRQFSEEFVGRRASWYDIRRLCEGVSGRSLTTFFEQWVRRSGAPALVIDHAAYRAEDRMLTLAFSQGEPAFALNVPVRITHADGTLDVEVPIAASTQTVALPVEVVPLTVEVDPEYRVFRKVPPEDIIPTTAATRSGPAFASVLPAREIAAAYLKIKATFESSFEEPARLARIAGDIEPGALAERSALILGEAVHDPYVAAYLSAIEFPIRFTDTGFEFDGTAYQRPEHAVLCTVSHPGVPGSGVTVVFANSEAAIPSPFRIPMYDRSLVIFEEGKPVLQRDLENHRIVQVER